MNIPVEEGEAYVFLSDIKVQTENLRVDEFFNLVGKFVTALVHQGQITEKDVHNEFVVIEKAMHYTLKKVQEEEKNGK